MNAEQKEALKTLKIARGQIDATIRMIEEGRYCIDISNQIMAGQSLLKKSNLLILKQHMNHCVLEAYKHDEPEVKIQEVIGILSKLLD